MLCGATDIVVFSRVHFFISEAFGFSFLSHPVTLPSVQSRCLIM